MGAQSWIGVKFAAAPPGGAVAVLRTLISAGWRFDDHGRLLYLPRGGDLDAWQFAPLEDEEQVWREIAAKAASAETVGVALTWEATQCGGSFLIDPTGDVQLSTNIDRRTLGNGVTDVSWYLARIRQPLTALGHVQEWTWAQVT